MEKNNNLIMTALKGGLILAVVEIVIFMIQYILGFKPTGIWKGTLVAILSFAIYIIIMVVLLRRYRSNQGGLISFLNAFLFCLIMFISASLISTIFTYLFNNFFDPGYMQGLFQAQREWTEEYMTGKASEEQIASTLAKIDRQAASVNTIGYTVKAFLMSSIVGAIISLILGAIMQKKPNIFEEQGTGGVI